MRCLVVLNYILVGCPCHLASIGQLLCLAFLYGWRFFLNNISLDWLLTLTTQPSTSKLSDHPELQYNTIQYNVLYFERVDT